MEAIKFSSFRLLVSNSLGPLPGGLGAFGISWGTGSCITGFGSTLGDDAGSLPTGVTDPSVGLRFLFSGSWKKKKNKVLGGKENERKNISKKKWKQEKEDETDGLTYITQPGIETAQSHICSLRSPWLADSLTQWWKQQRRKLECWFRDTETISFLCICNLGIFFDTVAVLSPLLSFAKLNNSA